MLERCYKDPITPRRLVDGAAGPWLDGFAGTLHAEGYSVESCCCYVRTAADLGTWAAKRSITIAALDEKTLARFVKHRRRGTRSSSRTSFRAQRFLRYLRETGIVASRAPGAFRSAMVGELAAWMRDRRGLAEATIGRTTRVAQAFLDVVGEEPAQWNAGAIREFMLGYVRTHAPCSAGLAASGLRGFLRYLIVRGRCAPEVVDAVPKVPTWRMARLPRYLATEDVERVIAACDTQKHTARRNRALLLLLARLGLRSHEVVGLRLGDFDWQTGRLRVRGKGGREARLPLPQDVGDAILDYLKAERPAVETDHVLLCCRAPIGPLTTSGVRDVVGRAIERAGVKTPSRGALLRHSLATRLLREGAALDTIGAVLRHRDVDTTALYAKVDVALLRQVAQPWPVEVSSC
jgi:site-specific recombinase XerD